VIQTAAPPTAGAAVTRRPRWWTAVALAAALGAVALSIAFGSRVVSLPEVWQAIVVGGDDITAAAVRSRVPRTLLALLVGASLAMAGVMLQGVTRNPLADPYILGINSGASLTVVIGIAFVGIHSMQGYIWFALTGAALAAAFVYTVGSLGRGGPTPLKLALAGAITTAALTSLTTAILLPRMEVMNVYRFWVVGGVGRAENHDTLTVMPFIAVGVALCALTASGLNLLGLGDDAAAGLGVPVVRTRLLAATGGVLLCGAATALAGPIGFVGLVVPHLVRLVVGSDHRWLLPVSALTGAALLTLADTVGRVVARPQEIEVGIITALLGAPVFIWVVLTRTGVRA